MGTFKERFKRLLAEDNLTAKEVAGQLGIIPETVKNYTTLGSTPKMETLLKMCEAYPHWSPTFLIAGQGEPIRQQEPQQVASLNTARVSVHKKMDQLIGSKHELLLNLSAMPSTSHHDLLGNTLALVQQCLNDSEKLIVIHSATHHQADPSESEPHG